MSFSLRLTADLTLTLASPAINTRPGHSPIPQVSPETDFESVSNSMISNAPGIGKKSAPAIPYGSRFRFLLLGRGWSLPLSLPHTGASPASPRTSRRPALLTVPDPRPNNFGEGAKAS